jgi:hypothetical protein
LKWQIFFSIAPSKGGWGEIFSFTKLIALDKGSGLITCPCIQYALSSICLKFLSEKSFNLYNSILNNSFLIHFQIIEVFIKLSNASGKIVIMWNFIKKRFKGLKTLVMVNNNFKTN